LLFNTNIYKALKGGINYITFIILFVALAILFITLAILFVSYKSLVIVCYISAAFFIAWLVSLLNIVTCCYIIIFCWTLIAVDYIVSAVVLRLLWIVVIIYITALRSGVFWNLVIRMLMAAIIVLIRGFDID
jgi:hypothetical protein